MAFTVASMRLDGCLFGPPSERDYRTVFHDRSVPDRVDLRQYCTPVENQGQIGSCTANATVGALEFHYKRRDGRSPDLSRMFVYFNARRMRGQVLMDSGAQIREAMASIMAFGACREEIWPYNPMLFAIEPPPQAYSEAAAHEAIQYARVDGGQGAVQALAQGLPVVFGTAIPTRCYEEAAATGILPEATRQEIDNPRQGGHAMLIVGYDNIERSFLVRNSWGEGWGDHGYCRISYGLMDACSPPEEFWVVAELEKEAGFRLLRPGRAEAPAAPPAPPAPRLGGLSETTAKMRDQIRSGLEADIASSAKKIEGMLAGKSGGPRPPEARRSVMPCTACAGSGICPACHGRRTGCTRCSGVGVCPECGGSGVL